MFRNLGWIAATIASAAIASSLASKPSARAPEKSTDKVLAAPSATEVKPARKQRSCKKGEIRLRTAECPKKARCRARCLPRPAKGASLLCPEGRTWEPMACPPNARCLVGGRCKPPKASSDKTTPKCGKGRVATKVQCLHAPCPTLCLPARLDPSLKASPKVKVL